MENTSQLTPVVKIPFKQWAIENRDRIEDAQIRDAENWLTSVSDYNVSNLEVMDEIRKKPIKIGGKRAKGSPGYWAFFSESENGVNYLNVKYATFAGGGYSEKWSGAETVSRLYDGQSPISYKSFAKKYSDTPESAEAEEARRKMWFIKACKEYEELPKSGKNKYLEQKQVSGIAHAAGLKIGFHKDFISIPIRDTENNIVAIQKIFADRKKIYGQKKGNFITLGVIRKSKTIHICEGVSTGLSVFSALGGKEPVVVAIDAGNIGPVCQNLRKKYEYVKFEFWADNDQWKKENAGVKKSSEIAALYGAKIRIPQFDEVHHAKAPTDFNDLQCLQGIESVAGTMTQKPVLKYITKTEDYRVLAAESYKAGYNVTFSNDKYLPDDAIKPGVNIIKSGIGSGKSFQAFKFARNEEIVGNSIYISHLIALAEDAAGRDSRELYSEHKTKDLRQFPHISICVNSLPKLAGKSGNIPKYETVIIDEIEQLLRRLTTDIDNKLNVLTALYYIIKNAENLILLDADISPFTLKIIKQIRGESEKYNVFINTFMPGTDREVILQDTKEEFWAESIAEMNTKRGFITFNSKTEARRFYLKCMEIYPEKKILFISGDNGGDHEVKEFFNDVNGIAAKYDIIICTPSVSTGVSIDNIDGKPAFDYVAGCFSHQVNTPNDCIQALGRVRDTKQINVYISSVFQDKTVKEEDIIARWTNTHDFDVNSMMKFNGEGIRSFSDETYEKIAIESEKMTGRRMTGFALNFIRILNSDNGYTIKWAETGDKDAGTVLRSEGKEAEEKEYLEKIADAPDIDDGEYEQLSAKNRLTMEETAQKTRKEIKKFYKLDDNADNDEVIETAEADDRGKTRRKVKLLEIARAAPEHLAAMTKKQEDDGTLLPDATHFFAVRFFYAAIMKFCGIDAGTMDANGRTYGKSEAGQLIEWIEKNRSVLSGAVSLPSKEKLKKNPFRYIGDWLRNIGAGHERMNRREQVYAASCVETHIKNVCILRSQFLNSYITTQNAHKESEDNTLDTQKSLSFLQKMCGWMRERGVTFEEAVTDEWRAAIEWPEIDDLKAAWYSI